MNDLRDGERRAMERWLQPVLTGLVLIAVTFTLNKTSEIRVKVGDLEVKVAKLETVIQVGMSDRFTGAQGTALSGRISDLFVQIGEHEKRLDIVERHCAGLRSSVP